MYKVSFEIKRKLTTEIWEKIRKSYPSNIWGDLWHDLEVIVRKFTGESCWTRSKDTFEKYTKI